MRRDKKQVWRRVFNKPSKPLTPEQQLDNFFRKIELFDKPRFELYQQFLNYCNSERENQKDEISDALWKFSENDLSFENLYRIVESGFSQNPLSSYGSIVLPPGGRFNIALKSLYPDFQCLYIASDNETAYAEKFHIEKSESDLLTPAELALNVGPGSYSSYRLKINLSTVLDLRKKDNLELFHSIVKKINPPKILQEQAKKLKMDAFKTVQDLDFLYYLIMDPLYTRWSIWSDHPSTSQWLGYYIKRAGVGGIIYPSCRNVDGFNIAVFPDNIPNTNTCIELVDDVPAVPKELRKLDAENYEYFMTELTLSSSEIISM